MHEPIPQKPQGMHWRTYQALRWQHDEANAHSWPGLASTVEDAFSRLGLAWLAAEQVAWKVFAEGASLLPTNVG